MVAIPKGVVASPGPILQERWALQRAFALTPLSAGASGGLLAIVLVLATTTIAAIPALAQVRATLKGHALALASIDYSPDGRYVATGSYDKTAKIWDAVTGSEIATLRGHEGTVEAVRFSPDGKILATGSYVPEYDHRSEQ